VVDEEVRNVKITDGRIAIVNLIFEEDWNLKVLTSRIYFFYH